jgi:integrase
VVQKLAGHSDIKTTQKYYLAVRQEDMNWARLVQSKILANDLTDPLLTHSGQNMA